MVFKYILTKNEKNKNLNQFIIQWKNKAYLMNSNLYVFVIVCIGSYDFKSN